MAIKSCKYYIWTMLTAKGVLQTSCNMQKKFKPSRAFHELHSAIDLLFKGRSYKEFRI